jgi:predicted dehydrogenase
VALDRSALPVREDQLRKSNAADELRSRPVKVGLLGVGAWGLNQLRAFRDEPRCVLASVYDPDPVAQQRALAMAPVALARTPDEIFADRTIDAVVIATPAQSHAALATQAIAAGKHVLIEKPFAANAAQAERLAGVAKQANTVTMVGHLMLFHPVVVRLRQMLQSGQLGALHYMQSTRVNLGRIRRDENALWSFGPHDLSMIHFLTGQVPVSVSARGQCVLQPGVEDVVFLTMRFADGAMAHVHLSWLHPRKERRLTLVCEHKMVEFDDVASDKLKIYDKGYDRQAEFTQFDQYLTLRDGDVHIPHVVMEEPLRVQTRHFVDCILQQTLPLTDVTSALQVIQVLQAAQDSLAQDGLPVAVNANLGATSQAV